MSVLHSSRLRFFGRQSSVSGQNRALSLDVTDTEMTKDTCSCHPGSLPDPMRLTLTRRLVFFLPPLLLYPLPLVLDAGL